jgi:protoporphyrin/coproporphyrin ferrochelatase
LRQPFDAVLVIAFGGPQGPADVRPFLANVLRGRLVPPGRIEEVAHHYDIVGGVSPLTSLTRRQADRLRDRLAAAGMRLPVYVGMRNWHPYLKDTMAAMARDGVRRAVGVIAAVHRSYSSCTQYRENVEAARAELRGMGLPDIEVSYVSDWHVHPGFIEANADHVSAAFAELPHALGDEARLVFTAHSIPVSMAERYPYVRQLTESAEAILAALMAAGLKPGPTYSAGLKPCPTDPAGLKPGPTYPAGLKPCPTHSAGLKPCPTIAYQSRSGRPDDPWLGPDVGDYLRAEAAKGLKAAVLCPVGFICDHVEVLYDLDVEAAAIARELGIVMVRASTVNDHPQFIGTLADAVLRTVERYRSGRPLQMVVGA